MAPTVGHRPALLPISTPARSAEANGHPLGDPGGISPDYNYADVLVMDKEASPPNNYSLYDFFNFSQTPRPVPNITGAKYPAACFTAPEIPSCFGGSYPADPDNDANETN